MFLRKFLWFLSLSVFAAGLVNHFYLSGPPGAAKTGADPAAPGRFAAPLHRPNGRLLSARVGENSTFWYFTLADGSPVGDLLKGTSLLSWAGPPGGPGSIRSETSSRPKAGLAQDTGEAAGPGPADAGESPLKDKRPR